MASYFRPLRGTRASALQQLDGNAPLKNGEVFFEYPDGGPGTGTGKIKMGDANGTPYSDLPYFIDPTAVKSSTIENSTIKTSKIEFTNSSSVSTDTDATLLNKIVPASTTNVLFNALKQLLVNFSSKIKSKADVQTDASAGTGYDGYAKGVFLGPNEKIGWSVGLQDYRSGRPTYDLNPAAYPSDLTTAESIWRYGTRNIFKGIAAKRWTSMGDLYPQDKEVYNIPLSTLVPDQEYYDGDYTFIVNATVRSWNRTIYTGDPIAEGYITVNAYYNHDTREIYCELYCQKYFTYIRFCELYLTYIGFGIGGEPKYIQL